MAELVVALDGPGPFDLMLDLLAVGVRWFKVGPLTWTDPEATLEIHRATGPQRLFCDAKLGDHGPHVCGEYARRLAGAGFAALSTATDAATEAAVRGAEGTQLRVWRHVAPTSCSYIDVMTVVALIGRSVDQGADGVICGAWNLPGVSVVPRHRDGREFDFVAPGVRFGHLDEDDHVRTTEPEDCAGLGVTHAVVGRPIWRAPDPVAAARAHLRALA